MTAILERQVVISPKMDPKNNKTTIRVENKSLTSNPPGFPVKVPTFEFNEKAHFFYDYKLEEHFEDEAIPRLKNFSYSALSLLPKFSSLVGVSLDKDYGRAQLFGRSSGSRGQPAVGPHDSGYHPEERYLEYEGILRGEVGIFYRWIMDSGYLTGPLASPPQFVFVDSQNLSLLLRTPYETHSKEDWEFLVTKFDGIIFIMHYSMPSRKKADNDLPFSVKRRAVQLGYHGLRFRHLLFDSKFSCPGAGGATNLPSPPAACIHENEELYRILETYFGKWKILQLNKSAKGRDQDGAWVKSRVLKEWWGDKSFYRYKLLDEWTSCVGGDIKKIILGKRKFTSLHEDKTEVIEHFLEKVEEISVNNIPELCAKYWKPETGLDFLDRFLTMVHGRMQKEEDGKVFVAYWDLADREHVHLVPGSGHQQFVKKWFLNQVRKHASRVVDSIRFRVL